MKLTVTTPLAVVIDTADVAHLRAEDATGAFGILPRHADFLTVLAISVVVWRDAAGHEHYVAVHGGMLELHGGAQIAIATREAVPGDDLARLETEVLARFRRQQAEEQEARTDAHRLYLAAIGRIRQMLRSGRPDGALAVASASGGAGHEL